MAFYKGLEREITKAVHKSMNNHLIHTLSPSLAEKFELDEHEVHEFLSSFFEQQSTKKTRRTAYSEFQKDKRKKYMSELEQKGIITENMSQKEKMTVASRYMSERWKSMKAPHHAQDLEYYRKLAQEAKKKSEQQPQEAKKKASKTQSIKDKIKKYIMQQYVKTGYLESLETEPQECIDIFIHKYETMIKEGQKIKWDEFQTQIIDAKMREFINTDTDEEDSSGF